MNHARSLHTQHPLEALRQGDDELTVAPIVRHLSRVEQACSHLTIVLRQNLQQVLHCSLAYVISSLL